ncbi:CGNR zinc finger domain-containing protein [Kitasatospora sp. NPDC002227]|uniref:CGNR zinc finger domain-containing protein n=1 Tax=Kitasatospora sp. NPDC002227 TaxID=3154773 RepID=UPI00331F44E5
MAYAEDGPRGLYFLADLANLVRDQPEVGLAGLQAVVTQHGGPELGPASAARLREAVGEIAAILGEKDEDRAAEAINALLDRYPSRPRLTRLPGRPWAVHTRTPDGAAPAEWLLGVAGLALALWLGDRGHCAWGRCAAPGCGRYFIDTGRREPQRYCSTACGTRVRVAAHRAKRGTEPAG